jgi:hypothetical protein
VTPLHGAEGRCAPYFFIIGAFKGGTTSLYRYLSEHPGVSTLAAPHSAKVRTLVCAAL